MNSTQNTYTHYLQNLLQLNNIPFDSQQAFTTSNNTQPKQFVKGPLDTNLQAPLFGDILARYTRQMLLKQMGYQGQLIISKAKVGLIGAGGIGCAVALYLAGAGVGTLGLFDGDKVQLNNLHRQIGHKTASIGTSKTESLRATLHAFNPNIEIKCHPSITKQTLNLMDEYDLIIDGSDNPLCRYLVNDYLMSTNKKYLSGACVAWQAQITCYGQKSACYRCIWGNDQVSAGGCSTLGVIGPLPGTVGTVLATEALKLLVTGQSSLQGNLLSYDSKTCTFTKSKLRQKHQQCQACGTKKLQIKQYNYNKYVSCSALPTDLPDVPCIPWSQLIPIIQEKSDFKILDVRPTSQFKITNFKDSIGIPWAQLSKMSQPEIQKVFDNKDQPVYVSCRIGVLSKKATELLMKYGYTKVKNVNGGINEFGKLYDPNIVRL